METTIQSIQDLKTALSKRNTILSVNDQHLSRICWFISKIQYDGYPLCVFKSVTEDHKIHAALSKDYVVEVNKAFADDVLHLNDYLEEHSIEMEIINEAPVVVSVLYN